MRKLYYTCPIEVAYMMRNFSVCIAGKDNCEREFLKHVTELDERKRYYVHRDNLSIFEPQVGDILRAFHCGGEHYEESEYFYCRVDKIEKRLSDGALTYLCVDQSCPIRKFTIQPGFNGWTIFARNDNHFLAPRAE